MSKDKYILSTIFATLLIGLMVPVVVSQPAPVIDGVFTNYPAINEWDPPGPYPGADPTPKGTYIYFRQIGDYIYLMHDVITDNYPAWADTNYFPVWYKDGTTYEVWIHAIPNPGVFEESHLQLSPIDHNELTGVEVGYNIYPYYFQGKAGFDASPNSPSYHRMYEFRIHKEGFWKIHIEDITITSEEEENTNWGGPDPWNPTGTARYAAGTYMPDWTWFFEIDITPVGGVSVPVDKLGLLAPYIALAVAVVAIIIGTVYAGKRWFGKAVVQAP